MRVIYWSILFFFVCLFSVVLCNEYATRDHEGPLECFHCRESPVISPNEHLHQSVRGVSVSKLFDTHRIDTKSDLHHHLHAYMYSVRVVVYTAKLE